MFACAAAGCVVAALRLYCRFERVQHRIRLPLPFLSAFFRSFAAAVINGSQRGSVELVSPAASKVCAAMGQLGTV